MVIIIRESVEAVAFSGRASGFPGVAFKNTRREKEREEERGKRLATRISRRFLTIRCRLHVF